MLFNIIKILHIISFVSWMAGLLYLPRIFVYHADSTISKETSSTFKVMEKRLYWFIGTPAAIATWITGLFMAYNVYLEKWLIIKIVLVIGMTIFHLYCNKWLNMFANDKNFHSPRYFRIRNEVPTILLILIVILVILQPF